MNLPIEMAFIGGGEPLGQPAKSEFSQPACLWVLQQDSVLPNGVQLHGGCLGLA